MEIFLLSVALIYFFLNYFYLRGLRAPSPDLSVWKAGKGWCSGILAAVGIIPQLLGQTSCFVHKENFKHSPRLHTGMFGSLYFLWALKTQENWTDCLGNRRRKKRRFSFQLGFYQNKTYCHQQCWNVSARPAIEIQIMKYLKFALRVNEMHWQLRWYCQWVLFVLLQYLSNETNIYPHASHNIPGQCNFGLYKPNNVEHKEMFFAW